MNFIVYLLVLIVWAPSLGFSQMIGSVGGPTGLVQIESTDSGFPQGVAAEIQILETTTFREKERQGLIDGILGGVLMSFGTSKMF